VVVDQACVDAQTVEIIGRNYLVSLLARDGLEVARPERDRGVDLIAYLDLDENAGGFTACPIQMKAATNQSFGLSRKYEKFPQLLIVHIWHVHEPDRVRSFALTYDETFEVAGQMGWTKTDSWMIKHSYSTTSPSKRLMTLIEPYRMEVGDWKPKVIRAGSSTRGVLRSRG
jgi:hypothetical protein